MAITSQKQVMAANDKMAARTVGRVAEPYRKKTIGPVVTEIDSATSLKELKAALPGLIGKMDTSAMEKALVAVDVQAAMVGQVTAKQKSKRRNVQKSK